MSTWKDTARSLGWPEERIDTLERCATAQQGMVTHVLRECMALRTGRGTLQVMCRNTDRETLRRAREQLSGLW